MEEVNPVNLEADAQARINLEADAQARINLEADAQARINLEADAQAPQWRRVASSSELRVGDLVRRRIDPQNEAWLELGLRKGSVGVVVATEPGFSDPWMVGVSYFDAPSPSGESRRTVVTNLEVLDGH